MSKNLSIIGVDLGGTNARAGLVKHGQIRQSKSVKINAHGTKQEILDDILSLIDVFMRAEVVGIGIGVPTVLDIEQGIVYDTQNIPAWKEVHLKSILEDRFHIPVYINNDANCFVLGEKYFGKGKPYHSMVGLIVGTGLGAGIIINDKLYAGINCGAGEFGMITYKAHNFEYYCSGQFFQNEYGMDGDKVYEDAAGGDKKALDIFNQFGSNFGEAIKAILYALDPEIIILGGSVSKAFEYFQETMWESVKTFTYSSVLERLKIDISEIEHIGILGAAALYYDAQNSL